MPLVIFEEIAYVVSTSDGPASMLNDAMQSVSMLRSHRTDVNIKRWVTTIWQLSEVSIKEFKMYNEKIGYC